MTHGDEILFGQYKVRDRHQNDSKFRMLVDTLWSTIEQAEYTPTEIRQVAMLAQILYEERRPPKPIVFSRDDVLNRRV